MFSHSYFIEHKSFLNLQHEKVAQTVLSFFKAFNRGIRAWYDKFLNTGCLHLKKGKVRARVSDEYVRRIQHTLIYERSQKIHETLLPHLVFCLGLYQRSRVCQ